MDRIKLADCKEHFCKGLFFTSPIYSFFGLKTYEILTRHFSLDNSLSKDLTLKEEDQLHFLHEMLLRFNDISQSTEETGFSLGNMEMTQSDVMNIFMFRLRKIENFNKSKTFVLIVESNNGFILAAKFMLHFTEEKLFETVMIMIQTLIKTKDVLNFENNGFFNPNFIRKIVENSCIMCLLCFSTENTMVRREFELVQMQTNSRLFILSNPLSYTPNSFIFTNIRSEPILRISLEKIMDKPLFLDQWRMDPQIFGERSWSIDLLAFLLETTIKNTFLIYYDSNPEKYNVAQFSKFRDLLAQKLLPKDDQRKLLGEETIRFAYSEPSDEKGENELGRKGPNKNKFDGEKEGEEEVTHFLMKIDKWCKKCKVCQKKGKKSKSKYACKACTEELGRDITLCVDGCFAEFHQNRSKFLRRKPRQEVRRKKCQF